MNLPAPNTVLLVDDEASLRYLLAEELADYGYQVHTAANGQEALALLHETSVDVALIDFQMPGLNGLELMAALQSLPNTPELIMLTAHATLETSIEAMRRGGTDFLLKPCRIEDMLHSLQQAMDRRRQKLKQQLATHMLAESLGLDLDTHKTLAGPAPDVIRLRGLVLNPTDLTLTKYGQPITITPAEFKLLATLLAQPARPVTFQELAQAMHGQAVDAHQARDMIKSHIARLRHKLGHDAAGHPYLENVRGIGYKVS